MRNGIAFGIILICLSGCVRIIPQPEFTAFQTSASGDKLKQIESSSKVPECTIKLHENQGFQYILGFGGAFTESSAFLLSKISESNRDSIIRAYFSDDGARYSLCRTHMNSCDFSLRSYSYTPVEGDTSLQYFSVKEDEDDLIPMIRAAQSVSKEGFKLIASPWTAPPWMKDNNDWRGGRLLPEYYPVWARVFSLYAQTYQRTGIPIWGFTIENEPLGNNGQWESMHFLPEEMAHFTSEFLAPQLSKDGVSAKLLIFDQNKGRHLEHWAEILLRDSSLLPFIDGTAVHWYGSTTDWFPQSLQYTHELAKDKYIIHTEACIDSDIPVWKEDDWYWNPNATDWGYEWADPEEKHLHPPYVPTFRYAKDIIGCLNNWVNGWIDWNMVLDQNGGPNHASNWCIAPIIVNPEVDEVYFTPLYYVMCHFSKFIRPGAQRLGVSHGDDQLYTTAAKNPDGSVALVVLNTTMESKVYRIELNDHEMVYEIEPRALQTILIQTTSPNEHK